MIQHTSLLTALTALGVTFPAKAAEALAALEPQPSSRDALVETGSEREHLLGDLGGWRSWVISRGVHFQAGYIGEVFGNTAGGIERGAAYQGLGEIAVDIDLERLAGAWPGAAFRSSFFYPHGRSPSGQLVGDLQTLSNIDAYDSPGLFELWFEQRLWDDRFSVRAGQLAADAEFAGTDYGATLINSSFGWPAFISGNTLNTGPAFNRAALGARFRAALGDDGFVQAGIFDGDSFDSAAGSPRANRHGVRWHLSSDQGAFAIAETGWSINQGTNASGLPGTYKIGAWLHTADFADLRDSSRSHSGNHGFYIAGDQMIWREADGEDEQGLGLFFRGGCSPEDRSAFEFTFDTGLHYRGLLPGRDDDALALGFAYVNISDDIRRAERTAGASVLSDYELAVELTYQIHVTPWLGIQPDVQWIRHPGGSRALDDAFVVGLRTRVTF